MTPPYPGGRTLASWWTQLAAWRPRHLWVGHLLVHRVDAPVCRTRPCPLSPFQAAFLRALSLFPRATSKHLADVLGLTRQFVGRVGAELQREGLARVTEGAWTLTAAGETALERGEYLTREHDRHQFTFAELPTPEMGAQFLAVPLADLWPCPVAPGSRFDPIALQDSFRRSDDWKARFQFPVDLQPSDRTTGAPWQAVVVARPEWLSLVLVSTGEDPAAARLLAFATRPDGWPLRAQAPILTFDAPWPEVFGDLRTEPGPDLWRQAWREWCEQRGLQGPEVETCPLEPDGPTLRVRLGPRLLDRLRTSRSEAMRGTSWLLAGSGRFRVGANLAVEPAGETA